MTSPTHTFRPSAVVDHAVPRVLVLMTRNQRRGAESFACVLGEGLGQRGLSPRLLALASAEAEPRLPVHPLGPSPLSAATLWRLRREIRQADVVVACGSTTLPATVVAGVATGAPIIYQNIGDPMFWAGRGRRRIQVRAMLGRMSAVAALSEESARVLRSHFGVPATQVRVIHNARSAALFRPGTAAEHAAARHGLGLPARGAVVALIGALAPEKRVDIAIDAVSRMPADVRLVVAGDGPLREELTARARSAAPGRVHFLGQLHDLGPVLHAADAVVLTSASEGVPGALIEAGLSGLPAVATDVGYVRDIVVPGVTGELVPVGDVEAVADGLARVLSARAQLGPQARAHCVRNFDLDRVIDDWTALIRAVLARGGR
ncbi:MAG TPA: glycosyltransferase family 4 protein [Nocardioidaceae bacterium]|nr:glycosyltransferase family 4 protein [Nocardioidaceae bacterium]